MKKPINNSRIEGRLYEKNLRTGITKKGVNYISGKITIDAGDLNTVVVDVFEQAMTSKGTNNQKYPTLVQILETQSVVDGNPDAMTLKINSSLASNDYYGNDGSLITTAKNDGGFITLTSSIKPQATFEADILIKSVVREVRDEQETGRAFVNGFVFDYRETAHPIKFIVENPKGVEFFEDLGKVFIKVWGNQINSTITSTKTEESAFGDTREIISTKTRKELIITGCAQEAYPDDALTQDDVVRAMAARETNLADIKARQDAKNSAPQATMGIPSSPAVGNLGGYNF